MQVYSATRSRAATPWMWEQSVTTGDLREYIMEKRMKPTQLEKEKERKEEREQCATTGGKGHIARDCPKGKGQGDSKGKGKGGFQGNCYNCGEFGHAAWECTKQKGTPKGTKGGKGKGKIGIWQVDGEEQDWQWEEPEEEHEQRGVNEVSHKREFMSSRFPGHCQERAPLPPAPRAVPRRNRTPTTLC